MSSYAKGRRAENYIANRLKRSGAKLVIRSARSLTPVDLVAFFPDRREIWLIQVKAKRGIKEPKGYEDVKELEGNYRVRFKFVLRGKTRWWIKSGEPRSSAFML